MITYHQITVKDNIIQDEIRIPIENINLRTHKQILETIGFPLQEYLDNHPQDINTYGKDIIIQSILETLIENQTIKITPYRTYTTNGEYVLMEFVEHDHNYTDKGREDTTHSLGFQLNKIQNKKVIYECI